MAKIILILCVALFSQVFSFQAEGKGATISIFLKDPQDFKNMQAELFKMKADFSENRALDALLETANEIAEMNDRCGEISLTEELDADCQRFYEVELPAFENKYMELTGEVRLGSMKMASTLEERTQQLGACVDALLMILVSREQLYRLQGGVDLEPLDDKGAFDATYSFKLSMDSQRMGLQEHLTSMWMEKCGETVLRKGGDEFAPYFENKISEKNDSLEREGSSLIISLEQRKLSFVVGMRKNIKGNYYLNGVKIFSETISDDGRGHLVVDLKKKKVLLPLGKDGVVNVYEGRQQFARVHRDMLGRWVWQIPKIMATVDEGKVEDAAEESAFDMRKEAAYAELDDKKSESVKAAVPSKGNDAKKDTGAGNVRLIPLIASGVVVIAGAAVAAIYNGKAKKERDDAFSDRDAGTLSVTYQGHYDDAGSYQKTRNIGIGLAVVGAIGMGLSFVF